MAGQALDIIGVPRNEIDMLETESHDALRRRHEHPTHRLSGSIDDQVLVATGSGVRKNSNGNSTVGEREQGVVRECGQLIRPGAKVSLGQRRTGEARPLATDRRVALVRGCSTRWQRQRCAADDGTVGEAPIDPVRVASGDCDPAVGEEQRLLLHAEWIVQSVRSSSARGSSALRAARSKPKQGVAPHAVRREKNRSGRIGVEDAPERSSEAEPERYQVKNATGAVDASNRWLELGKKQCPLRSNRVEQTVTVQQDPSPRLRINDGGGVPAKCNELRERTELSRSIALTTDDAGGAAIEVDDPEATLPGVGSQYAAVRQLANGTKAGEFDRGDASFPSEGKTRLTGQRVGEDAHP